MIPKITVINERGQLRALLVSGQLNAAQRIAFYAMVPEVFNHYSHKPASWDCSVVVADPEWWPLHYKDSTRPTGIVLTFTKAKS